jgi:membrane protein DedA with SNARE-associated domain
MPFDLNAEQIVQFVRTNKDYAPLIIFLMSLGETIIVVSMFIPSTILFIAIGGLLAASGVPLVPSLIAGALGASLGFTIMYLISATMKERILKAWPIRNYPESVARAQEFSLKWGHLGVFAGHFTGPLRVVIPIAAGVSRMPPVPFMLANIVGSIAWIITFFAPSYLVVSSEWFRKTFAGVLTYFPGL